MDNGEERLDITDPYIAGVAVFRPLFDRSNRNVQLVPAPLARRSMAERAPYKSLTRGSIPPAPRPENGEESGGFAHVRGGPGISEII